MNTLNTNKLRLRFRGLFGHESEFYCGNGWFKLIWSLGEDLEVLAKEAGLHPAKDFSVIEVKEKLGGLRFYIDKTISKAMNDRIQQAKEESIVTCDICSAPALCRKHADGVIATRCGEHTYSIGTDL